MMITRNSALFKDSLFCLIPRRWATNLGGGSTTNGRDSAGKRLGIKLGNGKFWKLFWMWSFTYFFALGASVKVGQIIIKQRGFNYYPGENVKLINYFNFTKFIFVRLVWAGIIHSLLKGTELSPSLMITGRSEPLSVSVPKKSLNLAPNLILALFRQK